MNYQQWLQYASVRLERSSSSPRCDAEVLLITVTRHQRSSILAFKERQISASEQDSLEEKLARRLRGEPIAYLVGEREFWSLPLKVTPATLIPRPESELLVEHGLKRLPAGGVELLDLGTGSGAIALALAHERPDCQVTALDHSAEAIAVAQQNAINLGINNVTFAVGPWFAPVAGRKFSLIVANPPYLAAGDPHLYKGDLRFEPHSALVAGDDGLADLDHIVQQAQYYLLPDGWLLVEHGCQQGTAVSQMFLNAGYLGVDTIADYAGLPRLSLGQKLSGASSL